MEVMLYLFQIFQEALHLSSHSPETRQLLCKYTVPRLLNDERHMVRSLPLFSQWSATCQPDE